jgi:uncharacterized protein (TIGR02266 family)
VTTTRPAEASNPERRAEARLEMEVEVGLESDHNFYTGLTQDISSGGLFIATRITHRVGDRIRVRFTLPGRKEPIVAEAEVRWMRDPMHMRTDAPEGIGLRFVELNDDIRGEIGKFLEHRESLYYDVD